MSSYRRPDATPSPPAGVAWLARGASPAGGAESGSTSPGAGEAPWPVIIPRPSGDQEQQVRRAVMRAAGLDAPSSFSGDQLGALRRMAEEFGAEVAQRVSKHLGLSIEAVPTWAHEMLWREARGVPAGLGVNIVLRPALGGVSLLILDPALVALIAERLLGTEPDPARALRPVTLANRHLASRFTDLLIDVATQLWSDSTATELSVESVAQYKDADVPIGPTETVLVMPLEVQIFGTYSVIHMMMSDATVPPVATALARPSAKGSFSDPDQLRAVQARIAEINVDLRAQLGGARLSASAIAQLRPGDRLEVGQVDSEVALTVDGITVRRGRPGKVGTHRAIQLADGGMPDHG